MDGTFDAFLKPTDVINFDDPGVAALALQLRADSAIEIAKHCFEWVRDNIRHSLDHGDDRVAVKASDVLQYGTGLCYAKSHLLAALLRANRIPCGFVYQRLAVDETGRSFCLHGLNAVRLPSFGWYRVDPRGNRADIETAFDPPCERLAFKPTVPGEITFATVLDSPLTAVISRLQEFTRMAELKDHLPDWTGDR